MILSHDRNWIYESIAIPLKGVLHIRCKVINSCKGCNMLCSAYDRMEKDFLPYCDAFDVWNDFVGERHNPEDIFPNSVCKHHIRKEVF